MIVMRMTKGGRSHFVTRMPEWGLSGTLLAFAIQLLRDQDSFETNSGYSFLGRLVSQEGWGCFALVISSIWLTALVFNGLAPRTRRWSPMFRSICAFAASAFWAVNATAYLIAQPNAPGLINNAGFAFIALASSIIIAREVGVVAERAKNAAPSI